MCIHEFRSIFSGITTAVGVVVVVTASAAAVAAAVNIIDSRNQLETEIDH